MSLVVPLYIVIFGLLSMIFTLGLLIYHSELIVKNLTTKEEMNQVYPKIFGNPHKRTFCKNFRLILCPSIPLRSLLDKMLMKENKKYINRAIIVFFILFSIWMKNIRIQIKRNIFMKKNKILKLKK
jgi:hypothetical protein